MKALIAGLALAVCVGVGSQAQQQDFSQVQIKTTKLAGNFYMLEGSGGTIGVLPGPDGVFMVDTQFAPLGDKIVAAIKRPRFHQGMQRRLYPFSTFRPTILEPRHLLGSLPSGATIGSSPRAMLADPFDRYKGFRRQMSLVRRNLACWGCTNYGT